MFDPFTQTIVSTAAMDASFKKYLTEVLLLKDSHIDALTSQGIASFDDLQLLEEDDVKKICQIC